MVSVGLFLYEGIYNNSFFSLLILISTVKLFPDNTLFSVANDSIISANELNKDLQNVFEGAYKWKMSFNPDLNKQAQEVVFSRELNKLSCPKIFFNNTPVACASWEKHLGMVLDESSCHVKEKNTQSNEGNRYH